ncbi:hypothetical protein Aperf_G00000027384 [Anoplocephala perfoliata]
MTEDMKEMNKTFQDYEQELAAKILNIQNYRFYIDVKENAQGRFMKITETAFSGQRGRIFLSVSAAKEFVEKLDQLLEFLSALQAHNPESPHPSGVLKSLSIIKDNRRYFLDLKENERIRFLRVSMLTNGVRANMLVPSEGVETLRNEIAEMLELYFSDHVSSANPDRGKMLHTGNKVIFFDLGSNRYGAYLCISEVNRNARNMITVLEKDLTRFRDILNEVIASRGAFADKSVQSTNPAEEPSKNACKEVNEISQVSKKSNETSRIPVLKILK